MFRILRNLSVNVLASLIRDKEERHKFRNKYKMKSKFRKLRDDNIKLFNENKNILNAIIKLQNRVNDIEKFIFIDRLAPLTYKDTLFRYLTPSVYVSIACIAKNEGPYIKEWIEYHKIIGVERFYFYDNESTDNTKEVLEKYIEEGTVIYKYISGNRMQMKAYKDALYHNALQTFWMALIDLDEFIVPVESEKLYDVLKEYEQFPGLVVRWVCFDNSGHENKPSTHGGLVTANYTRVPKNYNSRLNWCFKSIVKAYHVVDVRGAHHAIYRDNRHAVNENFKEIPTGNETDPNGSVNKIRINHYFSKSKEEYLQKIKRGNMLPFPNKQYDFDNSRFEFKEETSHDFVIQKFIPKLKNSMRLED